MATGSTTSTETLNVEVMVCGYHVCQDIWDVALGKQLSCKNEPGDCKDSLILVPRTECSWSENQIRHGIEVSQSLIFAVQNKFAKTRKIKHLENLALYGI